MWHLGHLMKLGILILFLSAFGVLCQSVVGDDTILKYDPTWESLDKRPLPKWYDNAKVGIFIHWGVYSVPSFGSEWFWNFWQQQNLTDYINFMKNNYKPNFTYQEFAKGFTTELFNATQWATLFEDSGAKYIVLTSKHHDGFTLWPSSYSFSWNAKDVGPNRDLVGELSSAIRSKTSLKFGLYYSMFEWFNRMYKEDEANSFRTNKYVEYKALPELNELINLYKPQIVWSDGAQEALPSYWNATQFIAWLYNSSPVRKTVVTNDRWGIGAMCEHGDFYTCADCYNPGVLQKHKWENALTIDKTTWGHRFDTTLIDFLTSAELIKELVTTVSCGGNILVNVGPTKYGTIQPIFEERLRDMGKWLKVNGEAIYDSQPWIYQNDTVTEGVWYTKKSSGSGRTTVYATVLNYPYSTNEIDLYALAGQTDSITNVELLGFPSKSDLKWSSEEDTLHIQFPPKHLIDKHGLELAWTFKIDVPN